MIVRFHGLRTASKPPERTMAMALALGVLLLGQACTKREVVAVELGLVTLYPGTANLINGQTLQFTASVTDADGGLLPTATVTWRTDDPGVASIDAQGLLLALNEGRTTVHASLSGVEGTAVVDVFPGARLVLSEDSVALTAAVGVSPAPVVIELSTTGLGTVSGLHASAQYAAGQPDGWLMPTLGATTAPTSLTLTPETSTLPAGEYAATVTIDADGDGAPAMLPVTLSISAGGCRSHGSHGRCE